MNATWISWIFRLRERLWVQPLVYCAVAIIGVALARLGNAYERPDWLSLINTDMLEMLLQIIATSMLAVATFAVGSLVSAYASASSQGTPRSFQILVADDSSRNALSSYIGAFIFAVVSLVALRLGLFIEGGLVALFGWTMSIFAWVVLTFVAWTDNIARLGRVTTLILRAEDATERTLRISAETPALGGVPAETRPALTGLEIMTPRIAYVQTINMAALQGIAEAHDITIAITCPPGGLTRPGRAIARVSTPTLPSEAVEKIRDAFAIDAQRNVNEDPRCGLIILSEVAVRALSPGVNDPGTAISVIGRMTHLLHLWATTDEMPEPTYDRVIAPRLDPDDLCDDAFRAIARDGAGQVEVALQLVKALESLASVPNGVLRDPATRLAQQLLRRCELAMTDRDDLDAVRAAGEAFLGANDGPGA